MCFESHFSIGITIWISTKSGVKGGRHSSVVSFAPTILWPRVRIPSTPSMLFQFVFLKLYQENKQKEAGIYPFKKRTNRQLFQNGLA